MTLFRTPIAIPAQAIISHSQSFVSLGSCFAEGMGRRLLENKWDGLSNPFGTLFHPFAIFQILKPLAPLPSLLLLEKHGLSFHYRLPKTYHASTQGELQSRWERDHQKLHENLHRPGAILIITLGTAFVYRREGQWVANCHQQAARFFQQELSSVASMLEDWQRTLENIPESCSIIVTVSPVRHQKEGLVESSLSKSLLRVLAAQMVAERPLSSYYFPAYEIMNDELRDYRFYEPDMLHPTAQAVDYIWEKFQNAFIDENGKALIKKWGAISKRLHHRPLYPDSDEYRSFLAKLLKDLQEFPSSCVQNEIMTITEELKRSQSKL